MKHPASGTDWATVSAWAALATVAIYVAIGIFALIQVLQARKLREAQARPFVVVDFEVGTLIYLTVENIGRTMARDVELRFQPRLATTLSPVQIDETPVLNRPIPALPPGKKINVLFDSYRGRLSSELPRKYEVRATYKGDSGGKLYADPPTTLDLTMYGGTTPPPRGLSDLVNEVAAIHREIRNLTGIQGLPVRIVGSNVEASMTGRSCRNESGSRRMIESLWRRIRRNVG